eukprot:8944192-Pyramimonas_sp.AAC.1
MSSVIIPLPYAAPQSELLTILTCASCIKSGEDPPDERVPQPVMKHSSPSATSSLGKHATPMHSFKDAASTSSTRAKSYRIVELS